MTGGSRSRFLIHFALGQLKFKRKSGLHNKSPTKPGSRWTITFLCQKADSSPEDDVKEGSVVSEQDESESKKNVKNGEDHWDSYANSSSGNNQGIHT